MKTKAFISLIFLSILICCKSEKEKIFEKSIVGEWNFDKFIILKKENNPKEPPPLPFMAKNGYIFHSDKTCIFKPGFVSMIEGKNREENQILYLGNSTKYKIKNDSLKIQNLETNKWNNYKIVSITSDTMTLQKTEDELLKYYKTNYVINPNENYDKIIVSSSGCYGTCAIFDLLISKNDNSLFFGERYNSKNGIFSAKISKDLFKEIENSFKKSNITKLKNRYSSNWTDLNEISVTFIKDNKIIKTVSDYGGEAPDEFRMSYLRTNYLYQTLDLENKKEILPFQSIGQVSKSNKLIYFEKSEIFYLFYLLLNGKELPAKKISTIYTLKGFGKNDEETEIKSDGRFFVFNNRLIDIGFNFFELNDFTNRNLD